MKSLLSFYLLIFTVLILTACGSGGYEPEEEPQEEISRTEPVPADPTLEAVTWNLNWYGDGTYGSGGARGPRDENLQTKNIVKVLDSLKADLYAFQEVYSEQALEDITERMSGYNEFAAEHIDWIQKTAFIYNTNTIDSLKAGGIINEEVSEAWAGRFPQYFRFIYTYEGTSREFFAVTIHAKALDDEESYERRRRAALDLFNYLQDEHPDARILLLGDYNDDVDVSIHNEEETPYQPFIASSAFRVLTQVLSEADSSSTTGYNNMIDHITVSDELLPLYIDGSVNVFTTPENFIPYYRNTTSDHYPVWAKFDVTP